MKRFYFFDLCPESAYGKIKFEKKEKNMKDYRFEISKQLKEKLKILSEEMVGKVRGGIDTAPEENCGGVCKHTCSWHCQPACENFCGTVSYKA